MRDEEGHGKGEKDLDKKEKRVRELEDDVRDLKTRLDECVSDLKRERADFINYKERMKREMGEDRLYANQRIVEEFLEVRDNLERALSDPTECESVTEGVKLTLKQLDDLLSKHGIEEINPVGKIFDPQYHEALMVEEGEVAEETVGEVLQKGYILHSRVVRPAKVKIIKPDKG